MNAEQKQRAAELLAAWRATTYALHADSMAALLQEMIAAPAPEPVAVVSNFFTGRTLIIANKGIELPDGAPLYAAPPAPSVPDEELQAAFDRGLKAGNEQKEAQQVEIHRLHDLLAATTTQPEPPAELPTWENGDDPLVGGGLISRGVVDFATVGIWPTKPAPSVPVEPMENLALNEWLDKTEWVQKEINTFPVSSLGMHRADVMRLEIERLRKLLSAAPPPPPKLSDERILEIYQDFLLDKTVRNRIQSVIFMARAIEREILGGEA